MPTRFRAEVQAFLDRSDLFAVLATVNADGTPHQAVTWYERRGDEIVVNGRADRIWVANVRRTGSIALTIADAYEYVIASGTPRIEDDPAVAIADIKALARRYGEPEGDFKGQVRVTVTLRPDRIGLHGRLKTG